MGPREAVSEETDATRDARGRDTARLTAQRSIGAPKAGLGSHAERPNRGDEREARLRRCGLAKAAARVRPAAQGSGGTPNSATETPKGSQRQDAAARTFERDAQTQTPEGEHAARSHGTQAASAAALGAPDLPSSSAALRSMRLLLASSCWRAPMRLRW